jgi:ATP synthase protein I
VPEPKPKLPPTEERMIREVAARQKRMEWARDHKQGVLSQIGILGVIGWSVALPTLLGVALGMWIDHHWPSRFSWTLMLLVAGLVIGCVNAWLRVKEDEP